MDEEFEALHRNNTWKLVSRGAGVPIGCKWVYRVKRKSDGSVDRYKARLMAKGFLHTAGRDYFETYSPVMKPVTIRLVLTIAFSHRWCVLQLDINNAFLHDTLHEEVYMEQPSGYVDPLYPSHVCRLTKALYGLKQAPRAWYQELSLFLQRCGFTKSRADASLFIYSSHDVIVYFLVYVNDILLTGNNVPWLDQFVKTLSARFALKDLSTLHHFLGVEVTSTAGGMFLSQSQYITDILTQFKIDGAKDVSTPLVVSDKHVPLQSPGSATDATQFLRLLGLMQYFVITRPDVAFAVNRLSQFMHAPSELHWQAAKRLLRYPKGTVCLGLFLRVGQPLSLRVYTDSDWGGISTAGRSTTAYLVYLGTNLIS
ncbi:PREDICTED: uncharacterized protein LOC109155328 [Ipomoea nil]|uniref:uncharacterized protein LOC109155328 n=1 Tax=Ipomoea nil TaxID=35883 RepID=UPI0009019221|nr:PREDICTED: uncharacterized protein LOC109155328 [Ipomoea nil]